MVTPFYISRVNFSMFIQDKMVLKIIVSVGYCFFCEFIKIVLKIIFSEYSVNILEKFEKDRRKFQ